MQTIIKLPQNKQDLMSANISPSIIGHLESYQRFTDLITATFNSYTHITDFILDCQSKGEIFYLKTFPEWEEYGQDEVREFICYGYYHRDIPVGHKNLFFRIDQNWKNYSLPAIHDLEISNFIKKIFPLLSGTITTDTIFPPIILEQKWLNDKSELIVGDNSIDNLFLFSTDYFSRNYLLDNHGDVFELYSGKLTKTKFNFITWVDHELQNFFKHPKKP